MKISLSSRDGNLETEVSGADGLIWFQFEIKVEGKNEAFTVCQESEDAQALVKAIELVISQAR